VFVRGVIDHEVDQHPDSALFRSVGEFDKITERPIARIHAVIVGNVIAVVAAGRDVEGHQPDGRDAESMQVIQPSHQAGEVADSVTVGIHIGSDGKAVDDRVLVPQVIYHSLFAHELNAEKSSAAL
jgi:hypothetical protein